jgi:hypothetical protein
MRSGLLILVGVIGCGPSNQLPVGGSCKDTLIAGDVVLTEVFADFKAAAGGTGVDDGKEWFEIYNATDRAIDLEGLRIDHSRPDGTKLESHVMGAATLAPGQYFTLGNAAPDLLPVYVDYGYSGDLGDMFNSDGGKLSLNCADAELDAATYEEVSEGHARQLSSAAFPDYTINDLVTNWCEAAEAEFEPSNFGTPGSESDCRPVVIGECNDAGTPRPTVAPVAGDLIITEVMPNPEGAETGEWFEARVVRDVDLNGVGLDRAGDNNVAPNLIESPDCIRVTAGSYVVFAHSTESGPNGGLPTDKIAGTFRFAMVDTGDARILFDSVVIDAVTWTGADEGVSVALDPDFEDAIANDVVSNYCPGVGAYGAGGLGTPGEANPQCILLPPAGQCSENDANRAIVKPEVGKLVITEFLANAAGTDTDGTQEWIEIQNTGDTAFDLNDLGLKGNAAGISSIRSSACKSVAPGEFALFAHIDVTEDNGGLPAVDATFAFALAASNGSISVLDGGTVIDATTWQTPAVGDGVSRQLNPLTPSSTDNDAQANFCNSTDAQRYNVDIANFGTPKAANVCL